MKEYKNLGQKYFEKVKKFKSLHSKLFMVTNILTLLLFCERTYLFRCNSISRNRGVSYQVKEVTIPDIFGGGEGHDFLKKA